MNQETVLPVDQHKLALRARSYQEALFRASSLPCESEAEAGGWAARLKAVQAELKELDGERTELTKPLFEEKKRIDAIYKAATAPLEELKTLIKDKLAGYAEAKETARRAALAAAESAAQAGAVEECQAALAAVPEAPTVSGASVRWRWEFEVVDLAAVPREYLVVDVAKLKALATSAEEPTVPGVRFTRTASVVGR